MALKCRDIPDKASNYIDREGPVRDIFGVALHLSICPHCRTYVRGLRAVRKFATASLRAEVPSSLKAALGIGDSNSDTSEKDIT
jgi:anti-sigma factor ChrR (cupin superfamily)